MRQKFKLRRAQGPPQRHRRQPGRPRRIRGPGSGQFQGKVALITDGDSGIGRAVAVAVTRASAVWQTPKALERQAVPVNR